MLTVSVHVFFIVIECLLNLPNKLCSVTFMILSVFERKSGFVLDLVYRYFLNFWHSFLFLCFFLIKLNYVAAEKSVV